MKHIGQNMHIKKKILIHMCDNGKVIMNNYIYALTLFVWSGAE